MMTGASPRVVVVADPAVDGLLDRLEADGAAVVEATNVDETLEAIDRGGVGCVVSAAELPLARGATLCGEIRIRELGVPFVLCGPNDLDLESLAAAGGVDFVISTGPSGIDAADLSRLAIREAERYLDGTGSDEAREPTTSTAGGRGAIDALGSPESLAASAGDDEPNRGDDAQVSIDAERLAELERTEEMLDSLLKNVPASVYFKDRYGRHEAVSEWQTGGGGEYTPENAEGKLLPTPADFVGKTDYDLYPHAAVEEATTDDRRVMMTGTPTKDKIGMVRETFGEDQYFSTTKAPRYDEDGNVIGLIGITTQVTDRVQSEAELERQNERLSEFADVLAHDLRNPLTVARGHLDLAGTESDPHLETVAESLQRMERLIEEVLTYAREGRSVDDPIPVTLSTMAETAWDSVDTVDATLSLGSDASFEADPDRLQRLLENLFRNAVEHGGETVTVEVGALEDHGGGFYVLDDGPGLPEDAADVFERGFTTQEDGTGFGLSIVHNIASAHGWTVEVPGTDSEGDGAADGARFEIRDVLLMRQDASMELSE